MVFKFDGFNMLGDLQRALDRTRGNAWPGLATFGRGAFPPVNMFSDSDEEVVLVTELPGLSKNDVDIQVNRNQVRIRGTRNVSYGDDISLHRRERRSGSFDRTFGVPFNIDAKAVKAEHVDGVLTVRLPRAEQDKPRTITVH